MALARALALMFFLAACGDDGTATGTDSGSPADAAQPDGGSPMLDGGPGVDAGADAGAPEGDAGLPPPIACDTVAADAEALDAAIEAATPGTTVCLAAGTWTDLVLVVDKDGSSGAPITIAAERPGETIIDGTSAVRLGGSHLVLQGLVFRGGESADGELVSTRADSSTPCRSCRITEVTIDSVDEGAGESKWVSLYGDHNRVDHCWFTGKSNEGALLVVWRPEGAEDHHLVDHVYFGDRPPLGMNGAEGIRVGTSDTHDTPSYTTVEHNLFERMNGEIEIISNKSGSNVYRHNTFRESEGQLTLRHGDDCLVEGNWFFADGTSGAGGIRVIGAGHRIVNNYVQGVRTGSNVRGGIVLMSADSAPEPSGYQHVVDVWIGHNTVADSEQSIFLGAGGNAVAPRRITFVNNLVGEAQGAVVRSDLGVEEATWVGNIVFGESLGMPETEGVSFVDPMLARDGAGLWRPAASSPAIDGAAATDPPVATDVEGQPRDASPDVGADERSDTGVRYRPLERADVGPRSYDPAAL